MPTTPPTAFSVKPKLRSIGGMNSTDITTTSAKLGLEREQADRLDLDRAEPQLQRAAVAAGALAEEAAAADDAGVERAGRCRSAP